MEREGLKTIVEHSLEYRIADLEAQLAEARSERDCLSVCAQDLQAQVREHLESIRKLDDMWRHRMQAKQAELDDTKRRLDDAKGAMGDNKRLREALGRYCWHRTGGVEYCNACNCRMDDHAANCEIAAIDAAMGEGGK